MMVKCQLSIWSLLKHWLARREYKESNFIHCVTACRCLDVILKLHKVVIVDIYVRTSE